MSVHVRALLSLLFLSVSIGVGIQYRWWAGILLWCALVLALNLTLAAVGKLDK